MQLDDFLKNKALEFHLTPPGPKSQNHLGYLTQVYEDGSSEWGELWTDEPFEHPDQYNAWGLELASNLVAAPVYAFGYSYSIHNLIVLWQITKQRCRGMSCLVAIDSPMREWHVVSTQEPFAQTLWAIIR